MARIKRRLGSLLGPEGRVPQISVGSTTQVPAGTPAKVTLHKVGPAHYQAHFLIPRGPNGDGSGADDESVASYINTESTATRDALNARIGNAPLVVYHDTDHASARPDSDRPIMWVGSVFPVNSEVGDLHVRTHTEDSTWTPHLVDLIGWYDSSDLELAQGDQVYSWPDKSGRGYDLDILEGSPPTFDTTTLTLPSVRFGKGLLASRPLRPNEWDRQPISVYLVMQYDYPLSGFGYVFDGYGGGRSGLWLEAISGMARPALNQGTNIFGHSTIPENQPSILTAVFTGGNTTRAYHNDQLVVNPAYAGDSVISAYSFGRLNNGFRGVIAESLIVRNVTDEQHEYIMHYLTTKHEVTIS